MIITDPDTWRLQRINQEPRPIALIGRGRNGDEFVAWGISEMHAPIIAKILGIRLHA